MSGCRRFEAEGLDDWEQGRAPSAHVQSCVDCLARRRAFDEWRVPLREGPVLAGPSADWQARVHLALDRLLPAATEDADETLRPSHRNGRARVVAVPLTGARRLLGRWQARVRATRLMPGWATVAGGVLALLVVAAWLGATSGRQPTRSTLVGSAGPPVVASSAPERVRTVVEIEPEIHRQDDDGGPGGRSLLAAAGPSGCGESVLALAASLRRVLAAASLPAAPPGLDLRLGIVYREGLRESELEALQLEEAVRCDQGRGRSGRRIQTRRIPLRGSEVLARSVEQAGAAALFLAAGLERELEQIRQVSRKQGLLRIRGRRESTPGTGLSTDEAVARLEKEMRRVRLERIREGSRQQAPSHGGSPGSPKVQKRTAPPQTPRPLTEVYVDP